VTPAKQFRNAIIDGDEDKAITIYFSNTGGEGNKCLKDELPPDSPFPSKKNIIAETPLYLASKYALEKLLLKLLELGGDPSLVNMRHETCLHMVCSLSDKIEIRSAILDLLVNWEGNDEKGVPLEKISINRVDDDGNTAVHYASSNGLLHCVEKLISYGAIISIVNKQNLTCCEMADEKQYKDLASMLELALVFQPEDKSMEGINIFGTLTVTGADGDSSLIGKIFVDTHCMTAAGLNEFVEESIDLVSRYLGWMNAKYYRSRAEVLLNSYGWNGEKLINNYLSDSSRVLTAAKIDPSHKTSFVVPVNEPENLKKDSSLDEEERKKMERTSEVATLDHVDITFDVSDNNSKEDGECGTCMICSETMYCSQDVGSFIKGIVSQPDNRALSCLSGHTFCTGCWSSHLIVQVNENGLGCLPCPGFKCGEILDISWAPILLKSQDLVNRLKSQRQRNVIDCAGLKCCPTENCGCIIHIPSSAAGPVSSTANSSSSSSSSAVTATPEKGNNSNNSATSSPLENLLPKAAVCSNGHSFCLTCMQVAHSPCSCAEFPSWQKLVQEEIQTVNAKDGTKASGDDIANALWVAANTKRCPRCGTAIEKDEGCNHMR
jgi:hypothetical protein